MADNEEQETSQTTNRPDRNHKRLTVLILVVVALLLIPLSYAGYIYASSPEVIRKPLLEHYHFRMQVLVNGKAEDFGAKAYQQDYTKDQCNAELPKQPIHFHDNKDQLTHIHWEGITGGLVMKYYGWNFIGGLEGALGYRLDSLKHPQKVAIHGHHLPAIPQGAQVYVYTGDKNSQKERAFEDWKSQDLETFFGKTSNFPAHELNKQKRSLLDHIFPKASAHGSEQHAQHTSTTEHKSEAELTSINNLIGNVVLFAQKDKPTDQQVKDRFEHLVPLTDSTCGG